MEDARAARNESSAHAAAGVLIRSRNATCQGRDFAWKMGGMEDSLFREPRIAWESTRPGPIVLVSRGIPPAAASAPELLKGGRVHAHAAPLRLADVREPPGLVPRARA